MRPGSEPRRATLRFRRQPPNSASSSLAGSRWRERGCAKRRVERLSRSDASAMTALPRSGAEPLTLSRAAPLGFPCVGGRVRAIYLGSRVRASPHCRGGGRRLHRCHVDAARQPERLSALVRRGAAVPGGGRRGPPRRRALLWPGSWRRPTTSRARPSGSCSCTCRRPGSPSASTPSWRPRRSGRWSGAIRSPTSRRRPRPRSAPASR